MLSNIFLLDLKIKKDKNRKNTVMNFCSFNENNFFNGNLLKVSNINDKMFFNNKNEEEFIPAFEKTK